MKKYMLSHPVILATTILLGILSQGMGTAIAFFIMFIIDSITYGDMNGLITSTWLGAIVVVSFFILLFAYTRFISYYSYKVVLRLKNDIFAAILGTKISDFNQSNSAKHISLLNNDIKLVNDKYINGILSLTKDVTTVIFAIAAMVFLSPVNAAIVLVLSMIPMIIPAIFGKKLAKTNMNHMNKMAGFNEKVKDFMQGFEVIKTFGIERKISEKFNKTANDAEKARYEAAKTNVKVGSFSGTILIATQILTYLVAGYFVINGNITIGAVFAISSLSASVMQPVQYSAMNFASIKASKDVRESLMDTMKPKDGKIRNTTADFEQGIKLNDLSFKYEVQEKAEAMISKKKKGFPKIKIGTLRPGQSVDELLEEMGVDKNQAKIIGKPDSNSKIDLNEAKIIRHTGEIPMTESGEIDIAAVLSANGITDIDLSRAKIFDGMPSPDFDPLQGFALKNITYEFKASGKYAIVGGSGSGKSTLLKLLMGYYDDYAGSVLMGESEVRDIDRGALYSSLAMMNQNVFMLDDTLRNNITLYNDYSVEDYNKVIKEAQLEDLINTLPNGSDTSIGEGGNTLSGGERQRVAIARALIKGCKVIALDEAMASLDNETAYDIEKTLLETQNVMNIFVTHRYTRELLRKCDGVLVMRDGKLVEAGTFDELYEQRGYFYSLYSVTER
ncbi:MAG: ABC transporter ATP-binding protein/permease [Defluviitaleaceae bacterium]|nr:ABC transporter ATP-binding protein/permease [Defluviitaleaceae bacterium]